MKITIHVETEHTTGTSSSHQLDACNMTEFEEFCNVLIQAARGAAAAVGFGPELVSQIRLEEDE